jgi:hypothetical protein
MTTTGLASLWLAPRLPRFNHLNPRNDVRIIASNDRPDRPRINWTVVFIGRLAFPMETRLYRLALNAGKIDPAGSGQNQLPHATL